MVIALVAMILPDTVLSDEGRAAVVLLVLTLLILAFANPPEAALQRDPLRAVSALSIARAVAEDPALVAIAGASSFPGDIWTDEISTARTGWS